MRGPGRCRRTQKPSTAAEATPAPYFDTFTGDELMRLDGTDLDQLDAFDEDPDPEGLALWWHLRRLGWAEEETAS